MQCQIETTFTLKLGGDDTKKLSRLLERVIEESWNQDSEFCLEQDEYVLAENIFNTLKKALGTELREQYNALVEPNEFIIQHNNNSGIQ